MKKIIKGLLAGLKNWLELRGEKRVLDSFEEIRQLEFFHKLLLGASAHSCKGWKSPDGMLHTDAPIAVVVTRGGKVSGVIGFEIIGSTMLVRQMQGAPRGNYHDGTRVESYLLACAEKICHTLGIKNLRIVTAEIAIGYRDAAPPTDRPSEVARFHMMKIYSYPEAVGYAKSFYWRLRRQTYYRIMI